MSDLSNIVNFEQQDHSPERKTASVINWLFRELRENFRAFKLAWPTQEEYRSAKHIWLKAFMLSGIHKVEQIQHGLNKCYLMKEPFVPSPGEFLEWCRPSIEDLGLPEIHKAFEICLFLNQAHSSNNHNHTPTNTVIKHVIKQIGGSKLRVMTEKEAYKLFGHYYIVACRDYAEGKIQDKLPVIEEKKEPPKIPTEKERRGFKERMAKYQLKLQEAKLNYASKTYREFDEATITPGNDMFDVAIYEDFKNYLLSVTEEETVILPPKYVYRRMRLLAAKEQAQIPRNPYAHPNPQGNNENRRNEPHRPFKANRQYHED